MARRESFYSNLDIKRALLMASPFMAAALASQECMAVDHFPTDVATLRAAVTLVNAAATNDTIFIPAGTFALGAGGPLVIDKPAGNLILDGAGLNTILDGGGIDRVLRIDSNAPAAAQSVTIQDLTIQNGFADEDGAAGMGEARGGGIFLERVTAGAVPALFSLNLTNVSLSNCDAVGTSGANGVSAGAGAPGSDAAGGGIWMEGGTLAFSGCTISGNRAEGGSGGVGGSSGGNGGDGGAAAGGAIFMNAGVLNIANTTFSNNLARGGDAGSGSSSGGAAGGNGGAGGGSQGGAIFINAGGATITGSSAFTANEARGGDGDWGGSGGTGIGGGAHPGGDSGDGGGGTGGAIHAVAGTHSATGATFTQNLATGGDAGLFAGTGGSGSSAAGAPGGSGGNGGAGEGGGLYVDGGTFTLTTATLSQNQAVGGFGGDGALGGDGSTSSPGAAAGGNGGFGGSGGAARGGAVFADNGSTVNIVSSTVSANIADSGDGAAGGTGGWGSSARGGHGGPGGSGGEAVGGGVYVDNGNVAVLINASALSSNQALAGDGGAGGNGGDIFLGSSTNGANGGQGGPGGNAQGGGGFRLGGTGTFNIRNSTVSGNSVQGGSGNDGGDAGTATPSGDGGLGGNGGQSQGAGVFNLAGTANISNCTVASNTATPAAASGVGGTGTVAGANGTIPASQGGGFRREAGTLTNTSSIFADNTAGTDNDASGGFVANNCCIENGATPTGGAGNITGDPGLAALANNGGPTQTHAITGASSAANTGSDPLTLGTDQRGAGFIRVVGAAADMGAFEIQGAGGQTAAPTVTNPAAPVTVNAANFNVQGTAVADSLVRVYSDVNNDGLITVGIDTVQGSQQLTGGATNYSVSVTLAQNAANNFTATADDAANTESNPVNVPTITEDSLAPTGLVVTTPAAPVNTVGANFNIIGTAEAGSTVQIYSDANNNGLIDGADAVVAAGPATGGNFNISTPIFLGTANNFTATAMDAAGNESTPPVDVPTITETSTVTAPPVVTNPAAPVTVNLLTFDIQGTAVADSMVRIYSDANNNGIIDGADAVVNSQQLTGGATAFTVNVPLTQDAANNFTATADDAANPESNPVDVPTITDNAGGGGGGGGGDDGGGGCSTDGSRLNWLLFGGVFAACFSMLRNLLGRRKHTA